MMKRIIYITLGCTLFSIMYAQQTPVKPKSKSKVSQKAPANEGKSRQAPSVAKRDSLVPVPQVARIVFEEETHSFGDINKGLEVVYGFKFTNAGAGPLVILDVQGARADFSRDSIPAGGWGVVNIICSTGSYDIGAFRKEVMVTTNSVGQPIKTITLLGVVTQ